MSTKRDSSSFTHFIKRSFIWFIDSSVAPSMWVILGSDIGGHMFVLKKMLLMLLTVAPWVGGSFFPWDPVTDLRMVAVFQPTAAWAACDRHILVDTHRRTRAVSGHLYIRPSWSSRLMWAPQFSWASVIFAILTFLSYITDHPVFRLLRSAYLYRVFPSTPRPQPSGPSGFTVTCTFAQPALCSKYTWPV